jgi:arylamine N-acetyltransferase
VSALLHRLGLEIEPPSIEGLQRLHGAWVEQIPYETVWIHQELFWGVDPTASLDRIVRHRRGGYCYHLNGALALVLDRLGYQVTRHVGGVHGPGGPSLQEMANHLALVVHGLPTIDQPDGRWYVDVGLGDALHQALPLRPGEYLQAPYRFGLEATDDGVGNWHFVHDPGGFFTGMSFREGPVDMSAFVDRNRHNATSPQSFFAGTVTAQLRSAGELTALRGCVLTRRLATEGPSSDDGAAPPGDGRVGGFIPGPRDSPGDDAVGVASGEGVDDGPGGGAGHDAVVEQETFEDRDSWLTLLADRFGIVPGGPPEAVERLWRRVRTAHEAWSAARAGE